MTRRLPIVALVGRQNVGKSTLFNALVGKRRALVAPTAGTTRDRTTAPCVWRGRSWTLMDSGGIEERPGDSLGADVRRMAERAVALADVLCFVVDGKFGLTGADRAVAALLRRSRKPVVLAVNKMDGRQSRTAMLPEVLRLGFPAVVPVSAKSGAGTGDLLDRIVALVPGANERGVRPITLLLVGRTNVGKSSLLNRLAGDERVLVAPSPHTTRDPQDASLVRSGIRFLVTDTAGVRARRRARADAATALADASSTRTLSLFNAADVAALVVDATQPVAALERTILDRLLASRVSVMLVVNKWDLVAEKTARTPRAFEEMIRHALPFLHGASVLFVSAVTGQRVASLLETAARLHEARHRTLAPAALQSFVDRIVAPRWPARRRGGRSPALFSLTQLPGVPPAFRVQIGPKQKLPAALARFLTNALRDHFGFGGTPLRLVITRRLRR